MKRAIRLVSVLAEPRLLLTPARGRSPTDASPAVFNLSHSRNARAKYSRCEGRGEMFVSTSSRSQLVRLRTTKFISPRSPSPPSQVGSLSRRALFTPRKIHSIDIYSAESTAGARLRPIH